MFRAEFYAATNATTLLTVGHLIQKDVDPYSSYGYREFSVYSGVGMQKCSWYFTMSDTDTVIYQVMYKAQYGSLTTLVFSSPTLNEIETMASPTLQIPMVHHNSNFNSTQWNELQYVDSDGNLVPQYWTVPPLYGTLLFAADCRYTIDCGVNACNTTTGQCICPDEFTGVYCDQQIQITTGEAISGDQDVSTSVKVVFSAMVLVFGAFISL